MSAVKPAGWVVRITTQQLVAGTPMTMLYALCRVKRKKLSGPVTGLRLMKRSRPWIS
jgi:hypothetical protein